ncbi:histidinol-phosphate aminotransferase [Tistlia consotensis]|uniref:histidinol-phosphate transaminase n=1 Tax=Tistlia consotensis USBA 355 TaxID=560819 RepID=A0A1Y6CH72_9PROT|nr:aminotransferase class I/II-fold pyridoxal phosphate-dependent enzyme [Tistlia consotensis]SMF62435.1 histidinol-phosphate aminotransferase [Tistlia consotensis USBA 355]SNR94715.1 histidinol-phosphate aminotransferase [Tistlia consotensis]
MSEAPRPSPLLRPAFTGLLEALPATTPFVGPETLERRRGGVFALRLGANESAFGVSPRVQAVLHRESERANWYCDPEHHELREALAARLGVTRGNLVVGEGIDGLLGLIVRAFVEPGEAVVTSLGAYPTFNYQVNGYGGRLVFVPYREAGDNDLEALLAAARRERAKLLYLANPDNPSGSFHGRDAVTALLEGLPENCLLLLDEAYAEFAPAEELLPVEAEDPRLIRLRTFSKAHGLAGMRVGYAVAAREIVAAFDKIRLHFGVGRLAQLAAAAALDDQAFAGTVVRSVAEGREDYRRLGQRLDLPTLPSLTNFVAFDLGSAGRSIRMVELLGERGVFVRRPGQPPLDRYVRVTVGTEEERAAFAPLFADALEALGEERLEPAE